MFDCLPTGYLMKEKLNRYIDATEHLPPTPVLMVKLIECFRQPNHDIDEVVGLMALDPSLTAEVLKCCNGSFFGNAEAVLDVSDAVFRLGFYEVYRISVAMFGKQTMALKNIQDVINVEALWRHSAVTAVAAGAIARELEESEGLAFTAGLLHDAGKIVLASAEGARYTELLRTAGESGRTRAEAEKEAYGFHHGELGAGLLIRWGMPAVISEPVLSHHFTSWTPPFERISAIVSLGNQMAHGLDSAAPDAGCEFPEAADALKLLGLTHDNMPSLVLQARNDMKRLERLLPAA
jgi:putative nucleotidyltransferase with HDIG domain